MSRKNYKGSLRPEITLIEKGVSINWVVPETREIIWTETCTPKQGMSFASQIECDGNFITRDGYFINQDNKRHFVMHADLGQLGAKMR